MSSTKRSFRRFARAAIVYVALSATAASCKDSTGPGGLAGTWTLQTINGSSLPVIVSQDASSTERITGGTLVLNANSTFTVTTTATSTPTAGGSPSTFTTSDSGTWSVSGSTVTFTFTDSGSTSTDTGTVSGNTITVSADGDTFVFAKT